MDKEKVIKMLNNKLEEMTEFLNTYLSQEERNRFGEDIIRIMPNEGDIAKLEYQELFKEPNKYKGEF